MYSWYVCILDGEDDLTSTMGDADMNIDRNTQKRRYSRLSDGYERLKSVLPSVKDKRRVSKVSESAVPFWDYDPRLNQNQFFVTKMKDVTEKH